MFLGIGVLPRLALVSFQEDLFNKTARLKTLYKGNTGTSRSSPLSLTTFVLKEEVSAGIP